MPQFKLLTKDLLLCWVHDNTVWIGKLALLVWGVWEIGNLGDDYYRKLLAYKEAPSATKEESLRAEFERLFGTETGY